MQIRHRLR